LDADAQAAGAVLESVAAGCGEIAVVAKSAA
jgi:hypothetical protein